MKKIVLSLLSLLILTGILAAAVHYHHLHKPASNTPAGPLPSGSVEFRKILQRLNGPDSAVEVYGSIRIYDGEDSSRLKETSTFCMLRSGRKYYYQLSCLQTICNGSILLQIDTMNKTLAVKRVTDTIEKMRGLMSNMLPGDTLAAGISAVVSREHGQRVLRLRNEMQPEVRTFSLVYDTVDYRMRRAEVEWWKPGTGMPDSLSQRVWITKIDYHYRQSRPEVIDDKLRKVVAVKDNKIKLMPLYEGYRLSGELN